MSHSEVRLHLGVTPRVPSIKDNIDPSDFIEIRNVSSVRDDGKRMKQQAGEYEKIFACHGSERTLFPDYIINSHNPIVRKQPSF